MIHYYDGFLNKLKAIMILCDEFSSQNEEVIKDSFSSLLSQIISFKRYECEFNFLKSELESKEKLSQEAKDIIDNSNQVYLEEKNKLEKIIADNKLLNKAYLKIEFTKKENTNNSDEELELNVEPDSKGLIAYILKEEANDTIFRDTLHKREIVLESLVISLCTYLETFISNLTKEFYLSIHKGDLFYNKTISFKELKEIGDIDEARIFLIESELETLFRDGFHTWFKYVDKHFDITKNFKNNGLTNILAEINELYLRRNLYVHADGKINAIYLMHAPQQYIKGKLIGESLRINKDYINKKISIVEKIGSMMFFSFCLKKYEDKQEMFREFNNVILKEIPNSGNDIYSCIYSKFAEMSSLDSTDIIISKINYFLSYKLRGEYHEIKEEIESLDVSAYSNEYKRAKRIIMEDEGIINTVIDYFKSVEDDVFLSEIQWPLYDVIRNDEYFDTYAKDRLDRIFS